tara:strand:+ start:789 stop:965 length:177 start_codon:yes stop_codon:yes gene_type:complete
MKDLIFYHNANGSITISKFTDGGYWFRRTYYGYTKRQAVKLYRQDFKVENEKSSLVYC